MIRFGATQRGYDRLVEFGTQSHLEREKFATAVEVSVPPDLAGRTIAESAIRERTGCSVVAVRKDGRMEPVPGPSEVLRSDADMVLIGTAASEARFLAIYPNPRRGESG